MPETTSRNGGAVLIALAVLWLAFVVVYPLSWTPRTVSLTTLPNDRTAVPLKLPDEGPLHLMLNRGSKVTLIYETPGEGRTPGKLFAAARPTDVMPAATTRLEQVRVLEVTCLGKDRRSQCWAILSLPRDRTESVMQAGPVWVVAESNAVQRRPAAAK